MSRVAKLEHIVVFLATHADGILKDKVIELQNKLIKLRSLLSSLLVVYAYLLSDTLRPTGPSLR